MFKSIILGNIVAPVLVSAGGHCAVEFDHVIDIRGNDPTTLDPKPMPCATALNFGYRDAFPSELETAASANGGKGKDASIAIYCGSSDTTAAATAALKAYGFTAITDLGGLSTGQKPDIEKACPCLKTAGHDDHDHDDHAHEEEPAKAEVAATTTEQEQACTASGNKYDYIFDIRPQHMFDMAQDPSHEEYLGPHEHKQPCATHYEFWLQYEMEKQMELVTNVLKHVNNDKTVSIAVYCRGKNGANGAAQLLKDNGFTNVHSLGGLRTGQEPHIKEICNCLSPTGLEKTAADDHKDHDHDHADGHDHDADEKKAAPSSAYTCTGLGALAAIALFQ